MNEYTERLKNLVDQLFTCQFHFDAFADENPPIGMELRSVCEANYAIIVQIEGLITEIEKAPLETCCAAPPPTHTPECPNNTEDWDPAQDDVFRELPF